MALVCRPFGLVEEAEADVAFGIPGLELDGLQEILLRLLDVGRKLRFAHGQEKEVIALVPAHPDGLFEVGDGLVEASLAVKGLALAELDVGLPVRFLDVFLGRGRAGLGVVDPPRFLVAQDPVGVGDAVEDLVDLGLELGGELAVEPVGVEPAGHLEIGLLDVLVRGRLGDVQDLVEGHGRQGVAEGQDLGDLLGDVSVRRARRGPQAGLRGPAAGLGRLRPAKSTTPRQ